MKQPKILNCRYWILRNDEEARNIRRKIGGWENLGYDYPYVVGKERGFLFQDQNIEPIEDFFDKKENTIYKYNLQEVKNA